VGVKRDEVIAQQPRASKSNVGGENGNVVHSWGKGEILQGEDTRHPNTPNHKPKKTPSHGVGKKDRESAEVERGGFVWCLRRFNMPFVAQRSIFPLGGWGGKKVLLPKKGGGKNIFTPSGWAPYHGKETVDGVASNRVKEVTGTTGKEGRFVVPMQAVTGRGTQSIPHLESWRGIGTIERGGFEKRQISHLYNHPIGGEKKRNVLVVDQKKTPPGRTETRRPGCRVMCSGCKAGKGKTTLD